MQIELDLARLEEDPTFWNDLEAEMRKRPDYADLSQPAIIAKVKRTIAHQRAISRDVLTDILHLARERGLSFDELFTFNYGSLTDLLPRTHTHIYIGGHSDQVGDDARYTEAISASVYDLYAIRKVARAVTRDFSAQRFSPPWMDSLDTLRAKLLKITSSSSRRADPASRSLLSIGSPKANTLSEWLIAEALDLRAFATPEPVVERTPPFIIRQKKTFGTLPNSVTERVSAVSEFFEPSTPDTPAPEQRKSSLKWNGLDFEYKRTTDDTCDVNETTDVVPPACAGRDYAVILVRRLADARGHVVVAGLSGVGTYGACALATDHPRALTETPHQGQSLVYLVEVAFIMAGTMRWSTHARVLDIWRRVSERDGHFEHDLRDEQQRAKREASTPWFTFRRERA